MQLRDRTKVFIIDEVHQLSSSSFNALLKSVEEPPAHVVFIMATTELDKIPETILSRSQVYRVPVISTKAIADQLQKITDAEGITVDSEALQLIARDADGSMRDAQSKLNQVIAFTGNTITTEDVGTVLGLVGRDLLFGTLQAVADEDAVQAFVLAGRRRRDGLRPAAGLPRAGARRPRPAGAVGRPVARERCKLPARVNASGCSNSQAGSRAKTCSVALDLLTRAENDIRTAAQPRYTPRDGAAALDSPAQARRDRRPNPAGSGQPVSRPSVAAPVRPAPAPAPSRTFAQSAAPARAPAAARRAASAGTSVHRRVERAHAENTPARPQAPAAPTTRVASPDEFTPLPTAGGLGGSALKDAVLNEARASHKML